MILKAGSQGNQVLEKTTFCIGEYQKVTSSSHVMQIFCLTCRRLEVA